MRRPAHGGTTRPSQSRPGNGFARNPGRPGPCLAVTPSAVPEPEWFNDESLVPVTPSVSTPGLSFRRLLGQS
jgi:hypothetical protein